MATTTPKTFTRTHTQPLTSEDYEAYYVLTETTRRHRYALRLRHPVRAARHLARRPRTAGRIRRALHLAA